MVYCARCSWGGDIHTECIPPIPARQLHAKDTARQQRAKMLAKEQCHGLVRCVVLRIGCQEPEEPEHTLGSLRGNWMSLECVTGQVWIFQDMRHRLCLPMVSAG